MAAVAMGFREGLEAAGALHGGVGEVGIARELGEVGEDSCRGTDRAVGETTLVKGRE
jgi:hypothetical protein